MILLFSSMLLNEQKLTFDWLFISLLITDSIGYASVFSLTTAILPEFGKKKLGLRSNFNLMVLFGVGSLGSYAAGFFRSMLGSYKWPFMWNAMVWFIVAVAGLIKFVVCDRKNEGSNIIKTGSPMLKAKVSGE